MLIWEEPPTACGLPDPAVLALLKAASAARPERDDLRLQLARLLFRLGRLEEVTEATRATLGDSARDPELVHLLGLSAAAAGDAPLALQAFQAAVDRGADAHGDLAEALAETGRPDAALPIALQRLQRAPNDYKALGLVSRILLARGRWSELWPLCEALRGRGAWDGYVPSAMAQSAQGADAGRAVAGLFDLDAWLAETSLALPPETLAVLAAELSAHPRLTALPPTNATKGSGRRLDELEKVAGPAAAVLLEAIRGEVERYVAARRARADHPMISHAADRVRMEAWAISVQHDGHEDWHVHPQGWISGVCYVEVPDAVAAQAPRHEAAGSIQFGPLPLGQETPRDGLDRRTVVPGAGKLLLFPSYLGHRTWPTRVDARRTCVAFDVIRA